MNRFAALGLLNEATQGKTVLVLSHTQHAARDAMSDFLPLVEGLDDVNVRRANGLERITLTNTGRILFRSHRSNGCRGLTADIVFLDWDCEAGTTPAEHQRLHDDLQPLLATGAELVRA